MILGSKQNEESREADYHFDLTKDEYKKLIAGEPLKKRVEFAGGIGEFTISYKLKKSYQFSS